MRVIFWPFEFFNFAKKASNLRPGREIGNLDGHVNKNNDVGTCYCYFFLSSVLQKKLSCKNFGCTAKKNSEQMQDISTGHLQGTYHQGDVVFTSETLTTVFI